MVAPPNALHEAILAHDNAQVKQLLDAGEDADRVEHVCVQLMAGEQRYSPLNVAILSHNKEALDLLLAAGAGVNHGDPQPPVMLAVSSRRLGDLRALHAKGAWLEEAHLGEDGGTVLHMASNLGDEDTVKWLLEQGLNPNARDNYGMTPLLCACAGEMHSGHAHVAIALLSHGAHADCQEWPGHAQPTSRPAPAPQPLGLAIEHGYAGLVQHLLAAGANPNAAYPIRPGFSKPRSALGSAIWNETACAEITRLLIQAKADLSVKFEYDFNTRAVVDHAELHFPEQWRAAADTLDLLHLAAACDRYQEVQMLVEAGMSMQARSRKGNTPLLSFLQGAIIDPTPDVERTLAVLLAFGSDPRESTPQGRTGLHFLAQRYNHLPASEVKTVSMMQTLLAAGADPMQQDGNGMTALDVLLTASEPGCIGARLLTSHMDHGALERETTRPAMARRGQRL